MFQVRKMHMADAIRWKNMTNDSEILNIIRHYRIASTVKINAHNMCALLFEGRSKLLGVPAVIISAVVGSSIFASLASDNHNVWIMIITCVLSIGAAILAALQTFLHYAETAQLHKTSASRHESIRRNLNILEIKITTTDITKEKSIELLEIITKEMNDLSDISSNIPGFIDKKAIKFSEELATTQNALFTSSHEFVADNSKNDETHTQIGRDVWG